MPRVSDELYLSRVAAQMLHGGGARWNSGNRWFDKTLQVSSPQTLTHVVLYALLAFAVLLMPCIVFYSFCFIILVE